MKVRLLKAENYAMNELQHPYIDTNKYPIPYPIPHKASYSIRPIPHIYLAHTP